MRDKTKPNPSIFLSLLWNPTRYEHEPEFVRRVDAKQKISMQLPGLVKQVSETNDNLKRMNGLFTKLRDNYGTYSDNADDRRKLVELLEQFGEEAKQLKAFLEPGLEKREVVIGGSGTKDIATSEPRANGL